MITPTFGPISNRETWEERVALYDAETNEVLDISDADAMTIVLRDTYTLTEVLSGSLEDATIFLLDPEEGTFGWVFTDDQMGTLNPKTYEVGILLDMADEVTQVILGRVAVVRGL